MTTKHQVAEASGQYLADAAGQVVPVGYKQTEVGLIPNDWEFKFIGEIATVFSGGTPNRKMADYWGGDIPWVTTTLIDGSEITIVNEFITNKGLDSSAARWCKKGTILMAMYGQGKTRGKVAVLKFESTINQACAAIELKNLSSNKFVLHVLNSMYEKIRDLSNSGGQENLSSGIIKNIGIPYPSNEEQTAIANALSDVDALINELEKLIAKKQAIKTATMQQLLTGRTRLPEFRYHSKNVGWISDSASTVCSEVELVDALSLIHPTTTTMPTDGTPKGYKPSELGEIPEDWEVINLLDMVTLIHGKAHEPFVDETGLYIVVNSKFISSEGTVTKNCTRNECCAQVGDVLMVLSDLPNGKALAKCFHVVNENIYAVNQRVCIYRTNQLDSKFLFYILNRHEYFLALDDGVTQTHILNGDISACKLFLPSLKIEQTAIATILSDMDTEIQALQQRLSKTRQIKQGMMQELLTGKTRLVRGA